MIQELTAVERTALHIVVEGAKTAVEMFQEQPAKTADGTLVDDTTCRQIALLAANLAHAIARYPHVLLELAAQEEPT
jgi:hypothetical protein